MEFLILGPLEVRDERGAVTVGGHQLRTVLAVLLLHADEPVSADRLALALWGEDAPRGAVKTVQVYVSRLRRALGDPGAVITTAAGYRLRVRPGELDADRFERLVDDGRRALAAGQPEHAAAQLGEALALWRGPPLADLVFEPFAAAELARLEEQRLTALEARIDADLALGRHAELVAELRQVVVEHPRRERFAGQLMLALYRCGHQAEALEVYRDARTVLLAEIGVEPGPELRRLQEAVLRQDDALASTAAATELPPELDASTAPPLAGRDDERGWLRLRWERARAGAGAAITLAGVSGSGKLRLAADLAAVVHDGGAVVLYTSARAPPDALLCALRRAREMTRPTLLVVHAADRAGAAGLAELAALARHAADLPVLVLACCEDVEALAGLGADGGLVLGALDVDAVRAIARQYARGTAAEEVPADWLLEASGGVAQVVHEVAGEWARLEAARHVGAVAGRAAAGREEMRSIHAELTGGVEDLQQVREHIAPHRRDAPVVCPFKGLASFDVSDSQYFCGREKLVAELVARLVGAQLLGIVGPSGSGKSSVMRAGLLPAVASGVLPGSETYRQVLIRPGRHPLRELAGAMAAAADAERVVVAIDQFEETFTTCEDEAERSAFIAELVRMAVERHRPCVVVIALRADFYGRCAAYPELAGQLAMNHVLVHSMQRDELRRAIELPAGRVGLSVDSALADALVADVEDEPGALPLLSTALLELWQRRDGRRLRYAAYQWTGGVRGAVARLAEDAFGRLDREQQVLARSVLMRLAGEGAAGGVERRRVALAELEIDRSEDVAAVVALLTNRRLLTVSAGTIELAHEALMREWPRLRDWIDADREGLRIHRRLSAAAHEWEALGRDDGALYRGARLTETIEWNEEQHLRLNETEHAFLAACEAALRRDRVLRRRRIALGFGSLTLALVAISAVAVMSMAQSREARRQRDIAASRVLAARATSLLDSDPGLSRLIALAAYERHDTEQAENAVRRAAFADRAVAILPAGARQLSVTAPSADGRLVATAADDGSVRVWDLRHRRVAWTIAGHRGPATAAGFSPDGARIATAGEDGVVAIADVDGDDRRVVLTIKPGTRGHATYPDSVEFSSDGRRLVVGAQDGTVRLVDVRDGTSRILGRHRGPVRRARFDRAATRVVSTGSEGPARIWDVASGASKALSQGGEAVYDASFSPDGRHIATAARDGYLRICDVRSGRRAAPAVKDVAQDLLSARYSADGSQIVTAAADGGVRVYDARQALLLTELNGSVGEVYDAAFAGRAIVSGGEEGALRVWAPVATAALRGDATPSPSFSGDRGHVVWGDERGFVHRWDIAARRDRRLTARAARGRILVRASADGSRLVAVPDDASLAGAVRLYDAKSGRLLRTAPSHMASVYAVAIDRTGRRIAFAGKGPLIRTQAPDGSGRLDLRGHSGDVEGLAFSPDARHLASASADGTARIFDVKTGRLERTLQGHADTVTSVAYSSDGTRIVTADADATIRIWPVKGGAATVLYGHRHAVNVAAFDASGDRVVSTGEDGTVRVWNAAGGEPLVTLHQYAIGNGADVSGDGRLVVSQGGEGLSNSGVLRVIPCEVCGAFADVLRLARSRANRTLSATERQRLLGEQP